MNARRVQPDRANDLLRQLAVPPVRRTFHCYVDVPVTVDVSAVGDASALEETRRVLAEALTVVTHITVQGEPDCFAIDPPHTSDDGLAHRLVHTTLPLTVVVTATELRSVWPAAKRRLGAHLGRWPGVRVDIGPSTRSKSTTNCPRNRKSSGCGEPS